MKLGKKWHTIDTDGLIDYCRLSSQSVLGLTADELCVHIVVDGYIDHTSCHVFAVHTPGVAARRAALGCARKAGLDPHFNGIWS